MLNREEILQANDIQTQEVSVPEWGGSVLVRGLTGAERDRFEATIVKQDGKKSKLDLKDVRAKLTVQCVVDENGAKLFTDSDISALSNKSASALQRVFEVAQKLSGLTDDDVEELAKNSDSDRNDASISSLPVNSAAQ